MAAPLLVILAIASVISGAFTFRTANAQLEKRIQEIVADDLQHVSEHLWELDFDAIQSQLDAYVELGGISGARVTDDSGIKLQAGTLAQGATANTRTYTLAFPQRNGPLEIGVLTVETSRDQSFALARARVISLIASATITVFLSIFLIQRLLDRNVLSPIRQIARDLRQRPDDWGKFRINQEHLGKTAELDELVSSIHKMRDQILASQSEIADNQTRLAKAAEIAGLGSATSDEALDRFLECGENYAAMHGKTVDEMLQLSIFKDIVEGMTHPDELVRGRKVHQKILQGESLADTHRVRMANGEIRHIKKIFTAKEMPDGRVGVVDIVAQDVTEMFDMREQLLQTQKMEAIGKLTGGVAHDFNNILAVISGNLELLGDEANSEPSTGYVKTALTAVKRGATLTQQLLAFARKQTLLPKIIDVSQLVNDSAGLIRTSIGATIELKLLVDNKNWAVKADRTQLEAVLLNFVVNARDAMPNGGTLTIEVKNTMFADAKAADNPEGVIGEYVCLTVSDTGEGMSEETLEKACDPFFTTKGVGQGTGLGLSMAFGFAKQSGGLLKLHSQLGQGTTAELYLRRDRTILEHPVVPATTNSDDTLRGLHVFLVEDDEGLRETITTQIRSFGCVVSSAADGMSAIKLAHQSPHIDILLSDIVLPGGMDGRKVATELADSCADLAVVFMSGFSDATKFDEFQLHSKAELLQKPFSANKLKTALINGIAARTSTVEA